MTSSTPARDFIKPRLTALINDAVAQGFDRDVAVAVLIDLVTSAPFNTAQPDPREDDPTEPSWDRGPDSVVLVHGVNARAPVAPDAQDEADFIHPMGPLSPS